LFNYAVSKPTNSSFIWCDEQVLVGIEGLSTIRVLQF
jgi:hypothetical protein